MGMPPGHAPIGRGLSAHSVHPSLLWDVTRGWLSPALKWTCIQCALTYKLLLSVVSVLMLQKIRVGRKIVFYLELIVQEIMCRDYDFVLIHGLLMLLSSIEEQKFPNLRERDKTWS